MGLKDKVQKTLKSLPHPKDRKVDQFQKKLRREVRLDQQKDQLHSKEALVASRCFWFRQQVSAVKEKRPCGCFTEDELAGLALLHTQRNDQEVAELKGHRNPPQGRIKHLQALKQSEMDQLVSAKGMAVPNICDVESVDILLNVWDGDTRTVACLPMTHVSIIKGRGGADAASKMFESLLQPVEEVREAQLEVHVPSKCRRFTAERRPVSSRVRGEMRKVSVKASKSKEDIAVRGKERRVLQQQKSLKSRRQQAIGVSRGLL